MALDPDKLSVRDLRDELQETEDAAEIEAALEAERDGKARKSAIAAIEGRLNAVGGPPDEAEATEGAESASEAEKGSDDAEVAGEDAAAEDGQEAGEEGADGEGGVGEVFVDSTESHGFAVGETESDEGGGEDGEDEDGGGGGGSRSIPTKRA